MSKENKSAFQTWYAITVAWQMGFFISIPIIGFILLGIWGDKKLDTNPLLLLMGIVVGFLISVYEVHHLLRSMTGKHQ